MKMAKLTGLNGLDTDVAYYSQLGTFKTKVAGP